jgi:hypothetical protein
MLENLFRIWRMAKDETKVKGYYNNSLSRPEEKLSGEGSSCGMSLQGHLILGYMKEHFVLNDPGLGVFFSLFKPSARIPFAFI